MQALLDGVPVAGLHRNCTLAQAVEAASAAARSAGRIIVLVEADGARIDDPASHDGPVLELAMTSEEPRRLVRDALDEAAAALEEVRQIQCDAAELIHQGQPEAAAQRLTEVIGVWEGVKRVVDEGGLVLGRSLQSEAGMDDLLAGLAERLTSVKALLSASDWAGLADELAYDLRDEADRWRMKMLDLSGMLA